MWVRLKSIQYIEEGGKLVTRYPGDWVDIGKQTANLWVSQGAAEIVGAQGQTPAQQLMGETSGVVARGNIEAAQKALEPFTGLGFEWGPPELRFEKNLIWNNHAVSLRLELVPVGMLLLDTWQIAVPIQDYKRLAVHVGSDAEKEKTREVVHDLRVPLYEPGLLYVRKCPETERLIDLWQAEVTEGADEAHALLRAIYTVKPFILALPVTWINKDV